MCSVIRRKGTQGGGQARYACARRKGLFISAIESYFRLRLASYKHLLASFRATMQYSVWAVLAEASSAPRCSLNESKDRQFTQVRVHIRYHHASEQPI